MGGIFWSSSGESGLEADFDIFSIKVVDINMGVDEMIQANCVGGEELGLRKRPWGTSACK